MGLRRIFGPTRLDTAVGGRTYVLPASPGGRGTTVVQYQVVVLEASDASLVTVQLTLRHGPDGQAFVVHTGPSTVSGGPTPPFVMSWDANQAKALGEWLQLTISLTAGTAQWLTVEVHELRKTW